jgi:DNA polymerase
LPDERNRWLRQQVELGGAEVILSREARVGREPAQPPGPREPELAAAARQPAQPAPPAGPPARRPAWLKDAPAIPADGLVIEPEPWDFTEPRAQLETLEQVAAMVAACTLCPLCRTRKNPVPGEGDAQARLMLVGEGPGQTEDETGRPFVGAAGNLLDDILRAIEIPRERVFIANVVKCRPPKNRTPLPDEQATCLPYLRRQIELIRPKVLVALGSTAAGALTGSRRALGELRGQVHRWAGIPLIVTYHPAALLRNPNWKRPTWDDVRIARQLLDR